MLWKTAAFFRTVGALIMSYGLVREVFGDMLYQKGFGDLHGGEGQLAQAWAMAQEMIFKAGIKVGLLCVDHPLSVADKRLDTALAFTGFALLVLAMLFDVMGNIRRRV